AERLQPHTPGGVGQGTVGRARQGAAAGPAGPNGHPDARPGGALGRVVAAQGGATMSRGPSGASPRPGGPPGVADQFPAPTNAELRAIVEQGDAKTLVETAERVGRALAQDRLSTSQIRGVFGAVRQIEMSWSSDAGRARQAQRQLLLLKPKLAYQARREQGR